MSVALITGSGGLIGSESIRYFSAKGLEVVGIDNDLRKRLFGSAGSTQAQILELQQELGNKYQHEPMDIRNYDGLKRIFRRLGKNLTLVIHTAAQPSHDRSAQLTRVDFQVNASSTHNLLELTRRYAPEAAFIFTSTNKVYGDRPNLLPLEEQEFRFEIASNHPFSNGISEAMSIDQCLHSPFGASKLAADVMVQEYGRYFALRTACFRCGCISGPAHAGTVDHGFLSYLLKCAITETKYEIIGYRGKQVRDILHSQDLVRAFDLFFEQPRFGEVYNIGGGRLSNCSLLEVVEISNHLTGRTLAWTYNNLNRVGDHQWWISDCSKFCREYPAWTVNYRIDEICNDIVEKNYHRWTDGCA